MQTVEEGTPFTHTGRKEKKKVLKIKVEQNLTYKVARAQLDFRKKDIFCGVACRRVALVRVSVETLGLYSALPEKVTPRVLSQ